MKKISLLFLILFLASCSYKIPDTETFTIPKNENPPISGLFQVIKTVNLETGERVSEKKEEYAAFSDNLIIISEDAAENPTLRIRKVKLSDYLMRNFSKSADFLDIPDAEVKILTVYGENKMPYELILVDRDNIIFFKRDNFLFLNRIKETIDEKSARKILKEKPQEEPDKLQKTGIFFAIRYPTDKGYNYETDYLYFENGILKKALRDDDILVPSNSGLVRIVKEESDDEKIKRTTFRAEPLYLSSESPEEKKPGEIILPIEDRIEFVGRNYLTIERTNLSDGEKQLRMSSIKTPDVQVPMSLYDLFGKQARDILYSSGHTEPAGALNEENFGIKRMDMKWKLILRTVNQGDPKFFDYVANINIPERIVKYDENFFSKESIISHFPDAIDSFYSPKGDIIFIQTGTTIRAYPVENNQLKDKASMQWNLKEGTVVIMAEWMDGRRADETYDIFLENGGRKLEGVK